MNYHRPTATKDEHGGWHGPFPVIRNEPERGKVVCSSGNREISVRYPDAHLTLYIEPVFAVTFGLDNDAIDTILTYVN